MLEVEESLLPLARELHQQLEAHLRGLGLPPVTLEPATRFQSNESDAAGPGDVPGAVGRRFSGSDSSAEEAAGAVTEQHGEDVAANGGDSESASVAQASLERMQEHINSSSVSRVTAELAGQ